MQQSSTTQAGASSRHISASGTERDVAFRSAIPWKLNPMATLRTNVDLLAPTKPQCGDELRSPPKERVQSFRRLRHLTTPSLAATKTRCSFVQTNAPVHSCWRCRNGISLHPPSQTASSSGVFRRKKRFRTSVKIQRSRSHQTDVRRKD